ncbi:MAG: metalloregulator ArsR/SmtB family transcription factor [Burkholderiaceae bacterium]
MSANTASEIDALSAVFSALSDPTRRAMLARLSQGEASVNELAAPFKMSLPAVSKHIKVLEKAGLLTKTINAQQRPCKIDGVQLKQAVDWIDQYKQLWEERLDRLDAYLVKLHASETSEVTAKSTQVKAPKVAKNTTKKIATQAINTLARGEKIPIKQAKPEKSTKVLKPVKTTPKASVKPQEKTDDNDPNNIQQQIGFDF